jgi:GT2 family glycosyltransferase
MNNPKVSVLTLQKNIGCTISRNVVYQFFKDKYPNLKYFCFMDQDVLVLAEWARNMIAVMQTYPKAGIVAWPQANIGQVKMRHDGCVSMVASCCNMHRVEAIEAVIKRFKTAWDERFFFYRFDSLFAQRNNQVGYRTYLCLRHYIASKAWLDQSGGISHPKPNSGIKKNKKWKLIRHQSDILYKTIKKEEGWTEFDPFLETC